MLSYEYLVMGGFLFLVGAAVGSFINVFIYRTVSEKDWVNGRSVCEHCGKKIAWYDLVPIFSYLLLRGKCRHCQHPIAPIHPIVEALVGFVFLWWYFIGSVFFRLSTPPFQAIQPAYWLLAGILLTIILIADILYYLVPDEAVLALLIITFLYRVALTLGGQMQLLDLGYSLLSAVGLVTCFYGLHWITRGKGFGLGDVKLAAPLALILGWPKVLVGVFLAFLIGSVFGVAVLLGGKARFDHKLPFAPFLIIGTLVALVFGQQIWQSYLSLL